MQLVPGTNTCCSLALVARRRLNSMPQLLGASKTRPWAHGALTTEITFPIPQTQRSPEEKEACSGPRDMDVGKRGGMQTWLAPGPLLSLLCTPRLVKTVDSPPGCARGCRCHCSQPKQTGDKTQVEHSHTARAVRPTQQMAPPVKRRDEACGALDMAANPEMSGWAAQGSPGPEPE